MQWSQSMQGLLIQEEQGKSIRLRKKKVRCKASWLRGLNKAHFQKEGKDNKESCFEVFLSIDNYRLECTKCKLKWLKVIKRCKTVVFVDANQLK